MGKKINNKSSLQNPQKFSNDIRVKILSVLNRTFIFKNVKQVMITKGCMFCKEWIILTYAVKISQASQSLLMAKSENYILSIHARAAATGPE